MLPTPITTSAASLYNASAGGTAPNRVYTISGSNGSIANNTPSSTIELNGKDADIIINGESLAKCINTINKRLLILEPKKELLDKYDALQQAYEHYKTLEALLHD